MCWRKLWCSTSGGSLAISAITSMGSSMVAAAMPYTACQPNFCANGGANSTASTVPLLPAPAMPMARPLYLAGYQPEPSDSATPKLAPAMPSSTPMASTAS
jgi:hypothetical protein